MFPFPLFFMFFPFPLYKFFFLWLTIICNPPCLPRPARLPSPPGQLWPSPVWISWRRSPPGPPEASRKGSASSLRTRPGRNRQEQRTEIRTSELQIFVPDQASGIGNYYYSTVLFTKSLLQGEVQIETQSRNLGRHNEEKLIELVIRVYEYNI